MNALVDIVDCISVPGFNGEMILMMEFMRDLDDVMVVRNPDKGWRNVVDPQEGIYLALIHAFLYQILPTTTPRCTQEVIKMSLLILVPSATYLEIHYKD